MKYWTPIITDISDSNNNKYIYIIVQIGNQQILNKI